MQQPIGLEIEVGGKRKFVGKVATCPDKGPPFLRGRRICYREVPWKDVHSVATDSIGMDEAAWEEAFRLGAEYMVCYCDDRRLLLVVEAKDMNEAFKLNLGERLQIRVNMQGGGVRTFKNAVPIPVAWTSNVRLVRESKQRRAEKEGQPDPAVGQGSLFDE